MFRFSLSVMVSNLYFLYFSLGVEYVALRKVCSAKLLFSVSRCGGRVMDCFN